MTDHTPGPGGPSDPVAPVDGGPDGDGSGKFESGAAAFHVFAHARREGWRPLLLLGGFYLLAYLAILLLSIPPTMKFFSAAVSVEAEGSTPDLPVFPIVGWGLLWILGVAVLLCWYAVVDAALLRWLLGRGMRIRFAGAELKLIVLMLFFVPVLPFVLFLPFTVLAVTGAQTQSLLLSLAGALAFVVALPLWPGIAARFAPAAALSVRDGGFGLGAAWRLTAQDYWPRFGAYVLVCLVYFGASLAMNIAMQPIMMLQVMPMMEELAAQPDSQMDPAIMFEMMRRLAPVYLVFALAGCVFAFVVQAMLAGANVYSVKRACGELR